MRKLFQGGVFREEFTHPVLQIDHLDQIAVPGLIVMHEGEDRLGFMDGLRIGSQPSDGHFKNSPRICEKRI